MSFEHHNIPPLPGTEFGYHDLESLAANKHSAIQLQFDTNLQIEGSVVHPKFALNHNITAYGIFLGEILARKAPPGRTSEHRALAEHSVSFATYMGHLLTENAEITYDLSNVLNNSHGLEGVSAFIGDAPRQYQEFRPALGDLVDYVAYGVENSAEQHAAKHICWLILLQVEQARYSQFTQQATEFSQELDGLLTHLDKD